MLDYGLLRTLCTEIGLSGDEKRVRDIIINEIKGYVDLLRIDKAGNLIAFKKGKRRDENGPLAYFAHMDEVGFMIIGHDETGLLAFDTVGGIDVSVLPSKKAVFLNNGKAVYGVIGSKAVHVLSKEEKEKLPEIHSLRLDIGAKDKNEACALLPKGSLGTFVADFFKAKDSFVSKAIDDRAGCFLLINMIKRELEKDAYFVFTVEEECGLRGAFPAAYALSPTRAVIVDCTTASDVHGVSGEKRVCEQGKGAVVSIIDRSTLYDRPLFQTITKNADASGIIYQTKTLASGGNDAAAVQRGAGAVRVAAISLPTRYIHSPGGMVKISDIENTLRLLLLTNSVL